jgi:peptidoglycan/xylan/chitin deacetylase (PgdA/CDA1 family)
MLQSYWHCARRQAKRLLPPRIVRRGLPASADRAVLLTFDDGPHARVTPAVLDRLRAHGAHAVFFVVGKNVGCAPEMLRRIVQEGHLLGNHSHDHERRGPLDVGGWRRDLRRCQAAIEQHAGIRPYLFRPPYGCLSPASLYASWSLGLRTVTWSVDFDDWRCRTSAAASDVATAILNKVAGRDIILLHDDNACVLTILDQILPVLVSRQFDLSRGVALLGGVPDRGAGCQPAQDSGRRRSRA